MVQGKVGVVIVTYGNRFSFFSKTIKAVSQLKHTEAIVLISNGADESVMDKLKILAHGDSKIIICDLGYNSGSARGFGQGIKRAIEAGVDYIWLLDDDNLPRKDALDVLIKSWHDFNPNDEPYFSLLSYRPDRSIYKDAIQTSNPYLMLGFKNSFLGFHFIEKFKKFFANKEAEALDVSKTIGEVAVAPYGGMFFSTKLIDKIGYPDEKLFLYADDHEFSYRITQKGGKIILLLDSVLDDMERSFHLNYSKKITNTRFFNTDSKIVIFYSVRNNTYFEKNFITSKTVYLFNKYTYCALLFSLMLIKPKHLWKYPLILRAVKESKTL